MPIGVLYALAAYGAYAIGDAIIKGFGHSLSTFEIIFFITIFSSIPVVLTRPRGERLREVFQTAHPRALHIRALLSVMATLCVVTAFTSVPLAEVYSLVFLMPLFITILSVLVLRETITWQRVAFLLLGFAGVLLVVRPGFRAIEFGHIAALTSAAFGSVVAILLRQVSQTEKRTTIVGYSVAYTLVIDGILMLNGFIWPTPGQWVAFVAVGMVAGCGHVLIITAARNASANLIAPAQYSQILWAIVLGAIFYKEYPDQLALLGLGVVILSGMGNFSPVRVRSWFGIYLIPKRRRVPQPPAIAEAEMPAAVVAAIPESGPAE